MEHKSHFTPKLFLRRMSAPLLLAAMAVALQGVAFAHYPIIAASASCSNGAAVITYTVTSWAPGTDGGSIAGVDVYFNGIVVDTEPLTLPDDTFTMTLPAPTATTTVDVQAIAARPYLWNDGNTSSTPSNIVTVTIPTDCAPGTGRFTGGGKQVAVGIATVTKGFEVDCDLHQPSNNLEINWKDSGGAHQFHMTAFTSAACTLVGDPTPPPAPVNKILGMGTGRFDNTNGYTVVFTLIDNGEPGKNDEAGFIVYQTSNPGNVVLNVPVAFITGGNVQAHVDQK
jgi:hypothetical protein